MSGESADKLVRMANQIALHMALDPAPVTAVADHIEAFWTPRMKAMVMAPHVTGLSEIARGAIALLASGREPTHRTRATDPAARGSDAG